MAATKISKLRQLLGIILARQAKHKKYASLSLGFIITFGVCASAVGQAFQNLNFEQANPVSSGPLDVTAASGLPGWTVYEGSEQTTELLYNDTTINEVSVDLLGLGFQTGEFPYPQGFGIIDGKCSVVLQSGVAENYPALTFVTASIAQTGTVPEGTSSLLFKAWQGASPSAGGLSPFTVSFAGNNLSLVDLGSGTSANGATYTSYGANMVPFAGETGQLVFTSLVQLGPAGEVELDDIGFSSQSAEEPSSSILMGVGGLVIFLALLNPVRRE